MNFLRFLIRRIFLFVFLIYKHFFRNLISTSGLLLTLFIIFILLAVLRPIEEEIELKLQNSLPGDVLKITAKQPPNKLNLMGLFAANQDYSMGVQSWQLAKLKKLPEINEIAVTSILQMPVVGSIDEPFFKKFSASSELILQGVSYKLAKPYLRCKLPYKNTYQENMITVPLLIPESFANLAMAFATMNGLPSFSKKEIIGLKIKLELGNSTFSSARQNIIIPVRGVVCGFVPADIVAAIGVPYAWVHRLHSSRNMKKAYRSFDQVFAFVNHHKDIENVTQKIRTLNLDVPKPENNFNELLAVLKTIENIFIIFAVALAILSLISMVNAFMFLTHKRKYEFGLYLVFGSSPVFIWSLMILQGMLFSALHTWLAFELAEYSFSYLHSWLQNYQALQILGIEKIAFELNSKEKIYILLIAMTVGSLSSLFSSMIILGQKTLHLVRKEN